MDSFSPALYLGARKQKGLVKLFGGLAVPFYWTDVVVAEGTPMKLDTTQDKMIPPADTEGAKVIGLSLQMTYDDSAFGQLRGYHFYNDTRARLGAPVGLLTGRGYALTTNYNGTVAWGNAAYLEKSGSTMTGKMTAAVTTNNKLPVVFEGAGSNGATLVRIRFDFPLVS